MEELEESLELLRHAFEELKEIRDSLDSDGGIRLFESFEWCDDFAAARIQELIWKIGKLLGEF